MDFGEKIKTLREAKGITQQKLADQLYVTRQTVSRWECGSRYPDLLTAKSLADNLGTTIDELVSGENRTVDERQSLLLKSRRDKTICMLYPPVILFSVLALIICMYANNAWGHIFTLLFKPETIKCSIDNKLWLAVYAGHSVYSIVMMILGTAGLVKLLRKETDTFNIALIGIVSFVYVGISTLFLVLAPFDTYIGVSAAEGIAMYVLTGFLVVACIFGCQASCRLLVGRKRYNPRLFLMLGVFVVISMLICFGLFLRTHSVVYADTIIYIGSVISALALLIASAYLLDSHSNT